MTAREVVAAQLRWTALDEARRRETDALPTPQPEEDDRPCPGNA